MLCAHVDTSTEGLRCACGPVWMRLGRHGFSESCTCNDRPVQREETSSPPANGGSRRRGGYHLRSCVSCFDRSFPAPGTSREMMFRRFLVCAPPRRARRTRPIVDGRRSTRRARRRASSLVRRPVGRVSRLSGRPPRPVRGRSPGLRSDQSRISPPDRRGTRDRTARRRSRPLGVARTVPGPARSRHNHKRATSVHGGRT